MSDRRHLVSAEVEKLLAAVKGTRNAVRDLFLLLLMFRHGLRVSEACGLRLSQVDTELRAIKAWLAIRAKMKPETDVFFISERRKALSRKTVWLAIRTYGQRAGLPLEAHSKSFSRTRPTVLFSVARATASRGSRRYGRHPEYGMTAITPGTRDWIKAASDARNPVLGSWRNAPNVVPQFP